MNSRVAAGPASILRDEARTLRALDAITHRVCAFAVEPRHTHAIERFAIHVSANDFRLLPCECIAIALCETGRERARLGLGRRCSQLNGEITSAARRSSSDRLRRSGLRRRRRLLSYGCGLWRRRCSRNSRAARWKRCARCRLRSRFRRDRNRCRRNNGRRRRTSRRRRSCCCGQSLRRHGRRRHHAWNRRHGWRLHWFGTVNHRPIGTNEHCSDLFRLTQRGHTRLCWRRAAGLN